MSKKTKTCQKDHTGTTLALQDLPASQKNDVRHRCAACAFELGFKQGVETADRRFRNKLRDVMITINDIYNGR